MDTYTKISDNIIEVEKADTTTTKVQHTLEFLLSQKQAIEERKVRDNFQRDKELAEVETLIKECGKLNIKVKVVEEVIPIEENKIVE